MVGRLAVVRRSLLALAILILASLGTTVPACSIRGIADGVRTDGGNSGPSGESEAGTTDGGCTADLARDSANCGRCGRSCTGPCDEGTCDVATIAEGQQMVASLAT